MSSPTLALSADPLAPIRLAMAAMASRPHLPVLNGLAPSLTVSEPQGWIRASSLVSGEAVDDLLDTAKQRWRAKDHAAAALAWKCYTYWVALPAVLGYAAARRVPLVRANDVLARWSGRQPFMTIGLAPTVEVAVLPNDPLAALPATARRRLRVQVVADDDALIATMRVALMDQHLEGILSQIRGRLHLGRRTLLGSLASGIAHGLSRAADVVPGPTLATTNELLARLNLDDLVDLSESESGLGLQIHRRTCCLAFTLPEPKICSTCCIR